MKKLIAMLAVVAVAPLANADTDFSWDGESRARFELIDNQNFADSSSSDSVVHRTKLGMTAKKGESWMGRVTLLHNYDFGATSGDGNTAGFIQDGIVTDNLLIVNEAYMNWTLNDSWTLQAGRRGIHWADGSVFGRNDYEAIPFSWDGVSAIWDHDMFTAELTWNKYGESANTGVRASDPESKVWGAGFNFKGLGDWAKTAHVHVLSDAQDEDNNNNLGFDLIRYGVNLAGGAMGVWYNLTYNGHSGDRFANGAAAVDMSGSMIDATVGYKMDNWGVHGRFHTDSGDDTTSGDFERYTDLASDRHGQAGKMDVLRYGNLTFINFGGMFAFNDGDCKLMVDYWIFTQTEQADNSVGGAFGANPTNAATSATEDAIGSELDIEFLHKWENNLELLARVGMFMPGDEFDPAETAMQYFLEARMPF